MKDTMDTVDMQELLLRGLGEILYDGPEGSVLRQKGCGTVITDITEGQRLVELLKELDLPEFDQIMVKDRKTLKAVQQAFGFQEECPCVQWVYTKKEPPFVPDCDIRLLPMELAEEAAAHYHLVDDSLSYIQMRIAAGQVWGIFEAASLAGFIGTHREGAMGMLEIFPDYRRKGYGYALEAYLIAWHLQQGWTPYCHVVVGNDSSTRLQQKLGLELAELPALWTN